jgi:hypothetical protein
MFRGIFAVTALCLLDLLNDIQGVSSLSQDINSRRTFLNRAYAATLVSGTCFFLDLSDDESSSGSFDLALRPQVAGAFERRDVGDETRSGLSAAFNDQAYQTNSRLEQDGFKFDTREEEKAKLSDALASFSYDSSTPKKKSGYSSSASSSVKSSTDSKSK